MSVNEKMTAIADNIRSKTGGTEVLTLDDMANGVNEVYDVGKKAQYNEFWDTYQSNGARVNYQYAFGGGRWNDNLFKPKYDLIGTTFYRCFHSSSIKTIEKVIDASKASNLGQMFYGSDITTIKLLIMPELGSYTGMFQTCLNLKNITVSGKIGATISFLESPLTIESMKSIISCLKDYSTESTFTYTLTLKDSCKTELEANTETVEFNGRNYTYFDLITAKGWNLA